MPFYSNAPGSVAGAPRNTDMNYPQNPNNNARGAGRNFRQALRGQYGPGGQQNQMGVMPPPGMDPRRADRIRGQVDARFGGGGGVPFTPPDNPMQGGVPFTRPDNPMPGMGGGAMQPGGGMDMVRDPAQAMPPSPGVGGGVYMPIDKTAPPGGVAPGFRPSPGLGKAGGPPPTSLTAANARGL